MEFHKEEIVDGKKRRFGRIGNVNLVETDLVNKTTLVASGISSLVSKDELKPILDEGWELKSIKGTETIRQQSEPNKPVYNFVAVFEKPKTKIREKLFR